MADLAEQGYRPGEVVEETHKAFPRWKGRGISRDAIERDYQRMLSWLPRLADYRAALKDWEGVMALQVLDMRRQDLDITRVTDPAERARLRKSLIEARTQFLSSGQSLGIFPQVAEQLDLNVRQWEVLATDWTDLNRMALAGELALPEVDAELLGVRVWADRGGVCERLALVKASRGGVWESNGPEEENLEEPMPEG